MWFDEPADDSLGQVAATQRASSPHAIAHPIRTIASTGNLAASTKRAGSSTDVPLTFAMPPTEWQGRLLDRAATVGDRRVRLGRAMPALATVGGSEC